MADKNEEPHSTPSQGETPRPVQPHQSSIIRWSAFVDEQLQQQRRLYREQKSIKPVEAPHVSKLSAFLRGVLLGLVGLGVLITILIIFLVVVLLYVRKP